MTYQEKQKQLIDRIVRSMKGKEDIGSTIVEMRDDYEDDPAICLTSVVFPDIHIQNRIQEEIIDPLRSIESNHYYYPPESLHITIKSIRTIQDPPSFDDETVRKADQVFEEIVPCFSVFDFDLKGLVYFPTSISLVGYSNETLGDLATALDHRLKDAGIPDDKKYVSDSVFFGNLTLCRFTSAPSLHFLEEIEKRNDQIVGSFQVADISLLTCNAVCSSDTKNIISTYTLASL